MALNYSVLACNIQDGQGNAVTSGKLIFTPTSIVTTGTNHTVVAQSPITIDLAAGANPVVNLLATDNSGLTPNGSWGWQVQGTYAGAPAASQFSLPYASGATQYFSDVVPAPSALAVTALMSAPGGTPQAGQIPIATGTGAASTWRFALTGASAAYARYKGVSTAVRETVPFLSAQANLSLSGLSGVMNLTVLPVNPGDVITNLGFITGTTAAITPTHWWTCLYDATGANLLAQSADQTTTAIGANTSKLLALGSPYTVPAGVYALLAGVMIAASTMPNVRGAQLNTSTADAATGLFTSGLVYCATAGTGLTTTAAAGPLTLAASGNGVYLGAN